MRRTLASVVAVGIERVVPLAILLGLPRIVGLEEYGRYVFVLSMLGLFQVLPDQGLETAQVASLGRARRDDVALAGRGALARMGVSAMTGAIGLAVLARVAPEAGMLAIGGVLSLGFLALAANPYRVLLRARLEMRRYLLLVGTQAAVTLLLLAVAVSRQARLLDVALAVGAGSASGLVVGRVVLGRPVGWTIDGGVARALVREGWPLVGAALAVLGGQQVVQWLTLQAHGPAAVGALGGAQKLCEAVGLLPQAIVLTLLPRLARADPADAVADAGATARRLAWTLLPVVLVLGVFGGTIVPAVFGPRFDASVAPLAVLAPAVLLGGSGIVLTSLLVALGAQRVLVQVNVATAAVMAAAAWLLVPPHAALGAALAMAGALLVGQLALVALPVTRGAAWPVVRATAGPLALSVLATVAFAPGR